MTGSPLGQSALVSPLAVVPPSPLPESLLSSEPPPHAATRNASVANRASSRTPKRRFMGCAPSDQHADGRTRCDVVLAPRSPVVRSIERLGLRRRWPPGAPVGRDNLCTGACDAVSISRWARHVSVTTLEGSGERRSAQADLLGHLDLDDLAVLHDEEHGPELELAEDLGDAQEDGALLVGECLEPLDGRIPLAVHAATLPVPEGPRGAGPHGLGGRYQAYASGAGPPGPGKISSRRARASSSSVISSARIEPSSCSIVRGPTIGAVTTGLASS